MVYIQFRPLRKHSSRKVPLPVLVTLIKCIQNANICYFDADSWVRRILVSKTNELSIHIQ